MKSFSDAQPMKSFSDGQPVKVIIAGGGTGGHIYPAISIARALQKNASHIKIIFVGTAQGLESKIVPQAGYDLRLIQSGQLNFQGQIIQKIKSVRKLLIGLVQSVKLVLNEKPDFVIGVGGYASAPVVLVAAILSPFMKIQTAIWEPNAHPGLANRMLSWVVNKSYLVFNEALIYLKSKNNLILGMPLRPEIENFKLSENKNEKFNLLCFGGSQGSMFLNDKLSDAVINNKNLFSQIKITHQTGPRDFNRIKEKYSAEKLLSENLEICEYIYDMPACYAKADLLFCRGGASTLAEAAICGVVPVIVPLPAADDHQQRNAEALVNADSAFMILQNNFDENKLIRILEQVINDKNLLLKMSERLGSVVSKGGADRIAQDILLTIIKSQKNNNKELS